MTNLINVIVIFLQVSVGLSVFAIGLNATFHDLEYLFRNPGKLLRAFLSMQVIMPVFAVITVLSFNLLPAIKIVLVALSVSPIPPILPKRVFRAGGRESYAISLLVVAALLSIVWIPLYLEAFERIFAVPLQVQASSIARLALISVLIPLGAGLAVQAALPDFARRAAGPISTVAMVMLLAGVLVVLAGTLRDMGSLLRDGTLVALVAFAVVGLIAGHLLGGPESQDRSVLAIYTAARHPGIAFAIAHANFPQQRLALAAVLLALLVSAVVSAPYVSWAKTHSVTA